MQVETCLAGVERVERVSHISNSYFEASMYRWHKPMRETLIMVNSLSFDNPCRYNAGQSPFTLMTGRPER